MEVLKRGFRRGDNGRYAGHELKSRVPGLEPVQNFGVWAMTLDWGYQCRSLPVRVRKEDVPNAK